MPELPEVQTTVNGLNKKVIKRAFIDVWSDWKKIIKKPKDFEQFKKELKNKKIKKIWRRAKNVVFDLSDGRSLLVHQKMTGHLLVGKWELKNEKWNPIKEGPLNDPYNRFLHLIFFFKNKKGRVKQVIIDPNVIAGIGNIYANEALCLAKIHPEKSIAKLNNKELKLLYQAIKKVLELGVKLGGESFSDYRKPDGTKGDFDAERKVYKRENQKCHRCGQKIKRIKISQRSAFFCPTCQKL